ncbi:DUF192 domain-containing protein [Natronomonas salina]|uniref:DUF192 domain-containing protein n=1 Tax=Natronomonas salina TaxID=1710540 RepID=UPI001BAC18EF|nr:DUF192 domain-containing protein [Natronomonas salina]
MTSLRTLATALLLVVALLATGCVTPFDAGDSSTPTAETPATQTATPTPSPSPPPAAHEGYDQTTVTVLDAETDAELGRVEAAVADNSSLRYTGLSDTEELPADRGMLFVHERERDLTYVMRKMDFGIDIVFVAENGTITSTHHATAPGPDEDGNDQGYSGTGRYVLEVNYEWTAERGIEAGDRVEFELPE